MWAARYKDIFDPKNIAVQEMHALISIIKPLSTWNFLATTLETRQACGGLGISSYSRIPNLHCDNHVNATWEGDNTVLLQQTSRFILKGMGRLAKGKTGKFETLYYLTMDDLSERKIDHEEVEDFKQIDTVQILMEYIAAKSAQEGAMAIQLGMTQGSAYDAWNNALPFDLNNAAKMYGELFCHNEAKKAILNCSVNENKEFLSKLLVIKGLTLAQEYAQYLLDFLSNDQLILIHDALLQLYEEVKYNVVYSFDFLEINDTMLRSTIGAQDGNCYDRTISEIFADGRNFGRPDFWRYLWEVRNESRLAAEQDNTL
jgi:acyl-CoA oxidase